MAISKTSDYIQIKIEMLNPSQEPPASSKAQNQELKDVLCAFKIKIESQNSEQGCIKDSDHIKIKIKRPNSSQKPPAQNQDLIDMVILCTFKIKV